MSYIDYHETGFIVLSLDMSGWEQIAYFEDCNLKEAYIFAKLKLKEYNDKSKNDISFVKTITIKNMEFFDVWNFCMENFKTL